MTRRPRLSLESTIFGLIVFSLVLAVSFKDAGLPLKLRDQTITTEYGWPVTVVVQERTFDGDSVQISGKLTYFAGFSTGFSEAMGVYFILGVSINLLACLLPALAVATLIEWITRRIHAKRSDSPHSGDDPETRASLTGMILRRLRFDLCTLFCVTLCAGAFLYLNLTPVNCPPPEGSIGDDTDAYGWPCHYHLDYSPPTRENDKLAINVLVAIASCAVVGVLVGMRRPLPGPRREDGRDGS